MNTTRLTLLPLILALLLLGGCSGRLPFGLGTILGQSPVPPKVMGSGPDGSMTPAEAESWMRTQAGLATEAGIAKAKRDQRDATVATCRRWAVILGLAALAYVIARIALQAYLGSATAMPVGIQYALAIGAAISFSLSLLVDDPLFNWELRGMVLVGTVLVVWRSWAHNRSGQSGSPLLQPTGSSSSSVVTATALPPALTLLKPGLLAAVARAL
jgi:uncharacterized membrane protein YdcZ (DUF606 family)